MAYYVLVGTKATRDRPTFLVTNQAEAARYGAQAARLQRIWYIGYQPQLPIPDRTVFTALVADPSALSVAWRSTESAYGDAVLTSLFFGRASGRPGSVEQASTPYLL